MTSYPYTGDFPTETGLYYRADLFEFARHGVPGIVTRNGNEYVGRPKGWGAKKWAAFYAHHDHKRAEQAKAGIRT